jgi:hypothetical protein
MDTRIYNKILEDADRILIVYSYFHDLTNFGCLCAEPVERHLLFVRS